LKGVNSDLWQESVVLILLPGNLLQKCKPASLPGSQDNGSDSGN